MNAKSALVAAFYDAGDCNARLSDTLLLRDGRVLSGTLNRSE